MIITGLITAQSLIELETFTGYYKTYQVNSAALAPLKFIKAPTEIIVIIGTWCPDCYRETPRFIRIMEEINNPNIKVSYIGIDRNKTDPEGLAEPYNSLRIPSVIAIQQGKEIGRIVEKPTVSLEFDLAKILA